MRTSSVLLALVLTTAGAAQSVIPKGRSVAVTLTMNGDEACRLSPGEPWATSECGQGREAADSSQLGWRRGIEELWSLVESRELDIASGLEWVLRTADRLAATADAG